MLKFHRHVPAPLRTLALTWLAVTAVGLCALVAEALLWVDRYLWIVLLVGTCLAAIVAFRRSRPARHPRFQQPPHPALRLPVVAAGRVYDQRTPAMALGLSDHVWTWREFLSTPSRVSS